MGRLTRDGTAEPVSRGQSPRDVRGQGNIHFLCSTHHEQDWQPYSVSPYSAICDCHSYQAYLFNQMRLDFACSGCCIIHTHNEINDDGVLEKLWAHENLSELASGFGSI